jgi:hypothetical protein
MYLQYTSDSASSPGIPQWHLSVHTNKLNATLVHRRALITH